MAMATNLTVIDCLLFCLNLIREKINQINALLEAQRAEEKKKGEKEPPPPRWSHLSDPGQPERLESNMF